MNHSDRFFFYRVTVEGLVRQDWFEELEVLQLSTGETAIQSHLDQAGLHGILNRVRDLGLVLRSVEIISSENGTNYEKA